MRVVAATLAGGPLGLTWRGPSPLFLLCPSAVNGDSECFPHNAQKICCLVNTLEVALNYFSPNNFTTNEISIMQHQQQNAQMFLLQAFKDPKYLCI